MLIAPPATADYGFYNGYIALASQTDLLTALKDNLDMLVAFTAALSEEELNLSYASGKWTIKEVMVHLADAERNFCYRILRFSRGDQAPLPPFNVHDFIINAHAADRSRENIMEEWAALRRGTIAMFAGMHPSMLDKDGPARDVSISVRALGFALVGHVLHHTHIINGRYLSR